MGKATVALLVLGLALRLALFAVNPPNNAFDDHYGPIRLIVEHGELPARDACWECYHPPAFYVVSAVVAKASMALGLELGTTEKLIQFMPCLYGVLTLGVVWLVLRRLGVSQRARLIAFGLLCVLPRHVYMSAMHSNDTSAVLAVATTAWLLLVAVQTGFRGRTLAALSLTLAVTVLTKYTALVVLPMACVVFAASWWWRLAPRAQLARSLARVLVLPLITLGAFVAPNIQQYGTPFPSNLQLFHDDYLQTREDQLDIRYLDLRPWPTITTPILSPDNRSSPWPLVTSRMWFDMEPAFLPFVDPAVPGWWPAYRRFLGGPDELWPGTEALAPTTLLSGRVLISLGLLPLALLLVGLGATLFGRWSPWRASDRAQAAALTMMPVLLAANVAGMTLTCLKFPYTFSMKAVYVMTGLVAYVVFVALGLAALERHPRTMRLCHGVLALLGVAATLHLAHLVFVMATNAPEAGQ